MAKIKELGFCKVCGNYGILTEEHIPPRSAFNDSAIKLFSVDETLKTITDNDRLPWDFSGLKFKIKQGGNKFKTLCSKCNSYFGTNYVNYYQEIIKSFAYFLSTINCENERYVHAKTENFKPLPFIKQVVAMFASLTNLAEVSDMKNFLLDKDSNTFNKVKYKIYMSVFKSGLKRISGWSVILRKNGHFLVSEIVSYPFIFVLLGNADKHSPENTEFLGTDITNFVDFKFDDEASLEISLPINECNINFPCDYRTQEEIIKCRELNIKNKSTK